MRTAYFYLNDLIFFSYFMLCYGHNSSNLTAIFSQHNEDLGLLLPQLQGCCWEIGSHLYHSVLLTVLQFHCGRSKCVRLLGFCIWGLLHVSMEYLHHFISFRDPNYPNIRHSSMSCDVAFVFSSSPDNFFRSSSFLTLSSAVSKVSIELLISLLTFLGALFFSNLFLIISSPFTNVLIAYIPPERFYICIFCPLSGNTTGQGQVNRIFHFRSFGDHIVSINSGHFRGD